MDSNILNLFIDMARYLEDYSSHDLVKAIKSFCRTRMLESPEVILVDKYTDELIDIAENADNELYVVKYEQAITIAIFYQIYVFWIKYVPHEMDYLDEQGDMHTVDF